MDASITIQNLSKRYRVYFEKPALIRNILPFLVSQGKAQEFWALRDVNFSVQKGECIGMIGPNGSGKSTLLSILAGVTAPTEGEVRINGKVSSLLSLGAGFNFELTGQENVYLNGAILGLSKAQIDSIYDDIVEFADLGKFMNAKLSTYSAGMNMRLGFAISIMVPFDLLLIDEILAVGDLSFQTKCFRAMKCFYEDEGKTIIMVSHELEKLAELCNRVVWFEHGRVQAEGEPSEVLKGYRDRYRDKYEPVMLKKRSHREVKPIRPAHLAVDASRALHPVSPLLFGANINMWSDGVYFWDDKRRRLRGQSVKDLDNLCLTSLRFPGMYYSNCYHWRDAIGDTRPLMHDAVLDQDVPLFFGTDEFISLCTKVGTEPVLVANIVDGTPEEAVGWLRHCREKGVRVRLVEVGTELYYDEFHPVGRVIDITPGEYASRYLKFARALRSYDAGIKLIASGCLDSGVFNRYRYPDWNRVLLEKAGGEIDYLGVHNTEAPIMNITPDYDTPPQDVSFEALLAAPLYVEENFRKVIAQLRERSLGARIAVTDYRASYTDVPPIVHGTHKVRNREASSINWARNLTVGAAIYEAMLLNVFMRHPEIEIAHRWGVQDPSNSTLYTYREGWFVANPQYYVQKMYNALAGKTLVRSHVDVAAYRSGAVGIIPALEDVPYIDAIAAVDEDRTTMAIFIVNRSLHKSVRVKISLAGFEFRFAVIAFLHGKEYDSISATPAGGDVIWGEYCATRKEIAHRSTGRIFVECPKHSLLKLTLYRHEKM